MIFCYVPFLIVAYLSTTSMDWNANWCLADTVVFLHSSMNPFLFCWRNRQIRRSVKKIMQKTMVDKQRKLTR